MDASTALQVFVSPFLGIVFENLGSLIQKEIGVVLGVNKELKKLSNTLSTIRDVIEDAEVKQIDNKPINNWLRRLKDLAYEADDILDDCATEALVPAGSDIKVTSPSSSSCFDFKGIMFRRSIGKKIKKLIEKFDEMADQRIKFHLNLMPENVETRRKEQRETSSFLAEPQVYGRAVEKEHIANLLLKGGAGEDVTVCCIIGMGGLGKTTLAQMVYNDEHIANHFQLRCWVCVSDHFVLKTLLKSIIESTGGNARDLEDLDPLQRRVQEIFSGKKFLLVLDDVWNEDQTKWYKLKSMLTCGGIGSSIIVTTRLQSVASITTTIPPLHLEVLSKENGWSLFKHYAFEKNERYQPVLEEIGKEIVKKCGGVPLAAKALGGLLRYKREENEWLFVRDSALWDLPQDKEDAILPALRLSYNHLPSQLKQCFSYCSIFPKDYKMIKNDLIHLWMANGFLSSKGSMELEDIGNEIFNELLRRSFFQEQKHEYCDWFFYKMHDLVHDLACSVTVSECTTVYVDKGQNAFKGITRHLSLGVGEHSSLSTTNSIFDLIPLHSQPLLRTFRLITSVHTIQHIQTYSNLECLRVLDLSSTKISTLHVSIRNLKHLRYLDLSFCRGMISLPDESICSLRNLQVLKLDHCYNLQVLPENMRKLTNLRHLGISKCSKLRRMPVGMGNLICLRTLCMFVVVPKSGRGISELHGLDHLTGELEIKGLEHVRNSKDAKSANLMRKKNISELTLSWSKENNSTSSTIEEDKEKEIASIGESLQPHSNIKRLYMIYYNGLNFPSWMSRHSCLPNLVEIFIVGWRRCENLPSLGNLPLLESLTISGMDSLKCIGDEFYGDHHGLSFPALKKLYICEMPNLEDWSSSSSSNGGGGGGGGELEEVFPSLEVFSLSGCPKLRTLPRLPPSLKKLYLDECNEMILERILENVSSSSLRFSRRCENLPSLGNLPLLEILVIERMDSLKCIGDEFYGDHHGLSFPALKELYIREMPNLEDWSSSSSSNGGGGGGGELEEEVFPSLEVLRLDRCPKLRTLPRLPSSLKELHLTECNEMILERILENVSSSSLRFSRRCENLPSLGNLPLLESLVIERMDSLKCIGDEFYGDHHGLSFPALKKLYICEMPNLEDWSSSSSSNGGGGGELEEEVFPSLEVLRLDRCPKLRTLPRLPSSLKELLLVECNEMILERITSSCLQSLDISSCKMKILPKELVENLPTLTDLIIDDCKKLVCLPEEMQKLTSLKTFKIYGCHSLKSLPELGNRNINTVMTRLDIHNCDGLTSVTDCLRHLTTLEVMKIHGCPELEFFHGDFQDLKSLRHLTIWSLPQMTCLPEGLQQVAGTLESLEIYSCSGMTSLPEWMDKFTSLQELSIYDCKKLKVLPKEVLQLTALKDVRIRNCHPDLHRRYTKETGED